MKGFISPLRISFVGGGTDMPFYYKKYRGEVITTAINKYTWVLINKWQNKNLLLKYSKSELVDSKKKIKRYVPLSKRQDKPDSALWLIKQHSILKDSQIAKLVGITKNSVSTIRNKSYWNFNNLNPKDPVAMGLFSQKELVEAIEKAERRIKKEKNEKEKLKSTTSLLKSEIIDFKGLPQFKS